MSNTSDTIQEGVPQVTGLEGQVTGLESQVTGLEGQVTELKDQVTELEGVPQVARVQVTDNATSDGEDETQDGDEEIKTLPLSKLSSNSKQQKAKTRHLVEKVRLPVRIPQHHTSYHLPFPNPAKGLRVPKTYI